MKFSMLLSTSLIVLLSSFESSATPSQVVLLRHAEKPSSGAELSPRGWQRAQALPNLFKVNPDLSKLSRPSFLFGMAPGHEGGSIRAIQTLQFLSEEMKILVDSRFTKKQFGELAQQILTSSVYDHKLVVICWQHEGLTDLARALGVRQEDQREWSGDVFDRFWLLDFSTSSTAPKFSDEPQLLLAGDRP